MWYQDSVQYVRVHPWTRVGNGYKIVIRNGYGSDGKSDVLSGLQTEVTQNGKSQDIDQPIIT